MVSRPLMCKQVRSLGPPGTLERSVGTISSPFNCPWEVRPLLFSLSFCVIFFAALKACARREHTTLVLAGSVFLVPLRCWETQESWAERCRVALFSLEERVDWKETTAATSPAAHWLFAGSLCPGINSPGEPVSLLNLNVLENWSNYQVAHLRSLQEPQGSEPGRGQTTSPTTALTPGGPWNPTQRRARLPREAHLSSSAQTSEHWRSDAGTEFSRTEARPGLYPGLHVLVQSTRSGLNVLIAESTRSRLNSISVDRTWGGLNLPCRRNLVRFKLVWGWSPRRHRSHTCRVSHHWTGGSPLCGN